MPQLLTPILTVAAAGLLDDKGLAPSANLISSISTCGNLAIIAGSQALLDMGDVQVKNILATIPPFLTGMVSANAQAAVPTAAAGSDGAAGRAAAAGPATGSVDRPARHRRHHAHRRAGAAAGPADRRNHSGTHGAAGAHDADGRA